MPTINPGAIVRFTVDEGGLGCLRSSHTVNAGDLGVYDAPAPESGNFTDWHIITVEVDGEYLTCPAHRSMFEVVEGR
jgi:hypothetical protein